MGTPNFGKVPLFIEPGYPATGPYCRKVPRGQERRQASAGMGITWGQCGDYIYIYVYIYMYVYIEDVGLRVLGLRDDKWKRKWKLLFGV